VSEDFLTPGKLGNLRLDEIQVDETFWGEGAQEIVRAWLYRNYDERTMPMLSVVQIQGKEGHWLLGWDTQHHPHLRSLLTTIFGERYARDRLQRLREQVVTFAHLPAESEFGGIYGPGVHTSEPNE
jgi:hypothetical protein